MKTLGEFIVEKQQDFPHATGELTSLLAAIKLAAKIIHRDINKAGLVDILGANGLSNIQGESQMKLDLYANEKLKAALQARGEVAGIASEEEDDIVVFDGDRGRNAKYVVLMIRSTAPPTSMSTCRSVPFSRFTAASRRLALR